MLSVRPWIGIALLAASWLFGLDYYELPSPVTQALLVVIGIWLLAASERSNPFRAVAVENPELAAATLLFLLPVIWWTPWPYRLAPLVIFAGVLVERVANRVGKGDSPVFADTKTGTVPFLRPVAAAWTIGGMILMLQAIALTVYSAVTARGHDLPALLVKPLAGLCRLAGIDAAGDGPLLVMQSMRQPIRLAITWDMVFDPVTMMFLVGGLAWIAIGRKGARNIGRLVLIVLAWLPVRAVLMVAIYLHRAALSDPAGPLHVANQFLSSWVLLAALIVPVLLAWRFVGSAGNAALTTQPSNKPRPLAPIIAPDASRRFPPNTWRRPPAASLARC